MRRGGASLATPRGAGKRLPPEIEFEEDYRERFASDAG